MPSFKERLQQILIRDKLISPEDLHKALEEQKTSGGALSKILVALGFVKEEVLTQVISEGLGLPVIRLSRFKIDEDVVGLISKELAVKYKIMPISLMGPNLSLVMSDPLNVFIIDSLKTLTGYAIIPIISLDKEIDEAIEKYYCAENQEEASEQMSAIIQDIQSSGDLELMADPTVVDNKTVIEEITDQAPIIRLTDMIIHQGVVAHASDIFIEPMEKVVRIRYRIDGIIREIDRLAKNLHFPIVSRIKVISNLDISEHRLPQDGRFKTIATGGHEVDFRVNVLPTALGEKVVLRILDQQGSVLDVEKLGFEPRAKERLKECAVHPHGLILTCGPTGSGKTTTLYSILNYVDSPDKNIVTVEDPVEYQMKGMNQVNIKPAMGLTFSSSLRSILRQDPDIIMIGEIRDAETLDIAVKAALTGHLVLSSLHTTTAAGSIVRMINMGIEPFLICSSVLAIIAQRLLRRVCPHCKEDYKISPAIAERVGLKNLFGEKEITLPRAKGCKKCFNIGYKGRVGITEILILSLNVKELILGHAGEVKIKAAARQEGMQTMREDGLTKAMEGLTTLEEVLRVTAPDDPKELSV